MKSFVHSDTLFISLNPAEHVAITLPGSMLDEVGQSGRAGSEHFVFFANEEGSLLRINSPEYEILKSFTPRSPFDEQLKKLISEHFLSQ